MPGVVSLCAPVLISSLWFGLSSGAANAISLAPTQVMMNRSAGSSAIFYLGTTAASWAGGVVDAGSVCMYPQTTLTWCGLANGALKPRKTLTIAQTNAITCDSTMRGAFVMVHDTVATAPVWNGAVTAAGAVTVNQIAHCDDSTSTWRW